MIHLQTTYLDNICLNNYPPEAVISWKQPAAEAAACRMHVLHVLESYCYHTQKKDQPLLYNYQEISRGQLQGLVKLIRLNNG